MVRWAGAVLLLGTGCTALNPAYAESDGVVGTSSGSGAEDGSSAMSSASESSADGSGVTTDQDSTSAADTGIGPKTDMGGSGKVCALHEFPIQDDAFLVAGLDTQALNYGGTKQRYLHDSVEPGSNAVLLLRLPDLSMIETVPDEAVLKVGASFGDAAPDADARILLTRLQDMAPQTAMYCDWVEGEGDGSEQFGTVTWAECARNQGGWPWGSVLLGLLDFPLAEIGLADAFGGAPSGRLEFSIQLVPSEDSGKSLVLHTVGVGVEQLLVSASEQPDDGPVLWLTVCD